MTDRLGVLLLHGIKDDSSPRIWRDIIEQSFKDAGRDPSGLESADWYTPSYLDLLEGAPVAKGEPVPLTSVPKDEERQRDRLNYFVRQSNVWRLANSSGSALAFPGEHRGPFPNPSSSPAQDWMGRLLAQVRRYESDAALREAILRRLVPLLDEHDRWVIVGHSLGSVVALDVVLHLPDTVRRVEALATLSSPLSRTFLGSLSKRTRSRFPFGRVGMWVNAFNVADLVPGGRGVSYHFPETIDVPIDGGFLDHSAGTCLRNGVVTEVLGRAILGSATRELAIPETDATLAWSPSDLLAVCGLQLAFRIEQELVSRVPVRDPAQRWVAARQYLLDEVANDPLAGDLRRKVDVSRDLSQEMRGRLPADSLSAILIFLATLNPVTPFDITVSDDVRQKALRAVVSDLGLAPSQAETALGAYKDARNAMRSRTQAMAEAVPGGVWPVLAVAGIGVMLVAPYAVIAAAPAGLAGAAAITGGLAALGPGGMMGGLVVLSGIAGFGSATTAVGLVGSAMVQQSPEQFRQSLVELMARALLNKRLQLDPQRGMREHLTIADVHRRLRREMDEHQTVSDEDSPVIKSLQRRLRDAEKALAWLGTHGLGPEQLESVDPMSEPDD